MVGVEAIEEATPGGEEAPEAAIHALGKSDPGEKELAKTRQS